MATAREEIMKIAQGNGWTNTTTPDDQADRYLRYTRDDLTIEVGFTPQGRVRAATLLESNCIPRGFIVTGSGKRAIALEWLTQPRW